MTDKILPHEINCLIDYNIQKAKDMGSYEDVIFYLARAIDLTKMRLKEQSK